MERKQYELLDDKEVHNNISFCVQFLLKLHRTPKTPITYRKRV